MYAQIVYKDNKIMELNNKILEHEKKMMDLQEFISEKNEVIRGRDKVFEVNQGGGDNERGVYQGRGKVFWVISEHLDCRICW